MNDLNPYASPLPIEYEPGVFMLGGHRTGRGLLHRRIAFTEPVQAELDYNGRNFRQRVLIGRRRVWHRISWVRIHPRIEFMWPAELVGRETPGRIEITFTRFLWFKRFAVFWDDQVIYDEMN